MKIDFLADMRRTLLASLLANPDIETHVDIQNLTDSELVVCYLNWRDRLVSQAPRLVIESREFSNARRQKNYADFIPNLLANIQKGEDLRPHLSKRVTKVYTESGVASKSLSRQPHLDLLLSHWGIHHLHISDEVEADGFVKRGNDLIYAIFLDGKAYMLDILSHADFANDHLIRVILNNWPDHCLLSKLNATFPGKPRSAEEIRNARANGVDMFINIDGQLYMSALTGGLMRGGTSGRNTRTMIWFLRQIREAEAACSDIAFVQRLYRKYGFSLPLAPDLRLEHLGDGWGIVDHQIGLLLYRLT
jgi:hypothetical protein